MEEMTVAEAQTRLPELVDAATANGARIDIVTDGGGSAVLLGARDFNGLRETIAVLSDPASLAAHEAGIADIGAGSVLDAAELRRVVHTAGHKVDADSASTAGSQRRFVIARSAATTLAEAVRTPDAVALTELLLGPLLDNPHTVAVPVSVGGPRPHAYSFRRGAHRVLLMIDDVRDTVEVTAVCSRAEAYSDSP